MARPSGSCDRRRSGHRPSNRANFGGTRRGVCVNYAAHAVPAEALVAEIMDSGGRAIAAMADVAEKAAVEAMVART